MSCNVCLDQDDGESAEFWQTSIIKGRKPHTCQECGESIPVGAEHERVAMKFDGTFSSFRTCLACVEIHRALSSCDREDGHAGYRCLGILWNDIEEYVFPEMTRACIEKCQTTAARLKLQQRWHAWKFGKDTAAEGGEGRPDA